MNQWGVRAAIDEAVGIAKAAYDMASRKLATGCSRGMAETAVSRWLVVGRGWTNQAAERYAAKILRWVESGTTPPRDWPFANDEVDAVAAAVALPGGPEICFTDILSIYRLEDGRFSVSEAVSLTEARMKQVVPGSKFMEEIFPDAWQAARYFVARRHALGLGFDLERTRS